METDFDIPSDSMGEDIMGEQSTLVSWGDSSDFSAAVESENRNMLDSNKMEYQRIADKQAKKYTKISHQLLDVH